MIYLKITQLETGLNDKDQKVVGELPVGRGSQVEQHKSFKKSFYYFILIDKSTSKDNSTLAKKLTFVLNINDKKMKLNGEQLCTWFGTWMFDY